MLGAAIARMFVAAAGNKLDLETSRQVTRANMNLSLAGSYSERLENHLGSLSLSLFPLYKYIKDILSFEAQAKDATVRST